MLQNLPRPFTGTIGQAIWRNLLASGYTPVGCLDVFIGEGVGVTILLLWLDRLDWWWLPKPAAVLPIDGGFLKPAAVLPIWQSAGKSLSISLIFTTHKGSCCCGGHAHLQYFSLRSVLMAENLNTKGELSQLIIQGVLKKTEATKPCNVLVLFTREASWQKAASSRTHQCDQWIPNDATQYNCGALLRDSLV